MPAAPLRRPAANAPDTRPRTITLKEIAADLADKHGLTRKQIEAVLDESMAEAIQYLRQGDNLRLIGLGTFYVQQDRPDQTGLNISSAEVIHIKGTKKLAFRPANDLNNSL